MPYQVDPTAHCAVCPFDGCVEDRRVNKVPGRDTKFRVLQGHATACCFDAFVPGTDNDPSPLRTFDEYLGQFEKNTKNAGHHFFGPAFSVAERAVDKVAGDVFELLVAAAIWNAFACWNRHMDGDPWTSKAFNLPSDAVDTPTRKVGILHLPHGYDTTKLFRDAVRKNIKAHEAALQRENMELGLSAPDLVGVRLPEVLPKELQPFKDPLSNLGLGNQGTLKQAHKLIEGRLEGPEFLFAVAIKRSARSDRLYQPLFEANILKYLIEVVLGGSEFKFFVHMGSMKGAAVEKRYTAASLISLLRGGTPSRAIYSTISETRPQVVAQYLLDELPGFPL